MVVSFLDGKLKIKASFLVTDNLEHSIENKPFEDCRWYSSSALIVSFLVAPHPNDTRYLPRKGKVSLVESQMYESQGRLSSYLSCP